MIFSNFSVILEHDLKADKYNDAEPTLMDSGNWMSSKNPFLRLSVLFSSKHTVLYKMQRALGSAQTSTTVSVAAEIGT